MTTATVFRGKNYRIDFDNAIYVLVTDSGTGKQEFGSFQELIEAHPICKEARQAIFGKSDAQTMVDEHPNAADLMQILSQTAYLSDQDWDRGQTTWTLDDGSQIRICGNDVKAIAQS